jgi:hypothetical protein
VATLVDEIRDGLVTVDGRGFDREAERHGSAVLGDFGEDLDVGVRRSDRAGEEVLH